jgi:hypothetical protein
VFALRGKGEPRARGVRLVAVWRLCENGVR